MEIEPVFEFLRDLKFNNDREWMALNRSRYETARNNFHDIVGRLIEAIIEFDPSLQGIAPKDCLFRLNRDIRFSPDKSPYKTHFGAFMAENGRRTEGPGYYLHLQPDNETFFGGGIYMPASELLRKIRQEVDYNPGELKAIVSDEKFRYYFGEIQGEKLKKAPKGYSPDHPNIEFLKLKSYVVLHKSTDGEALAPDFLSTVVDAYRSMRPLIDYLNVAIS